MKTTSEALSELLTVLDEEHAVGVIEHRKALRRPLTGYAARLLARQFAKCMDPNAGADAMILNGWQGFEPEWLERRSTKKSTSDMALEAARNGREQAGLLDWGFTGGVPREHGWQDGSGSLPDFYRGLPGRRH